MRLLRPASLPLALALVVTSASTLAPPASAQDETAAPTDAADGEAGAAEAGAGEADGDAAAVKDEVPPEVFERQIVAYVATGAVVASLAASGVFAFLAYQQYQCLEDVVACNETRDEPIVGQDFVDERSNLQHLTLFADMGLLLAAASGIVATTNYLRGFVFTEEDALTIDMFSRAPAAPKAPSLADLMNARAPEAKLEAAP